MLKGRKERKKIKESKDNAIIEREWESGESGSKYRLHACMHTGNTADGLSDSLKGNSHSHHIYNTMIVFYTFLFCTNHPTVDYLLRAVKIGFQSDTDFHDIGYSIKLTLWSHLYSLLLPLFLFFCLICWIKEIPFRFFYLYYLARWKITNTVIEPIELRELKKKRLMDKKYQS